MPNEVPPRLQEALLSREKFFLDIVAILIAVDVEFCRPSKIASNEPGRAMEERLARKNKHFKAQVRKRSNVVSQSQKE